MATRKATIKLVAKAEKPVEGKKLRSAIKAATINRPKSSPARAIPKSRSKSKTMAKENNRAGVSAAQAEAHEAIKSQTGNKPSAESLDKVRDILFGSQSREFEKRFARLEERLAKEAADLREDLKKRFDALEGYVKKEVDSLIGKLKAEHEQRTESAKEISRELKDASRAFEKRTGQLDEQLTANARGLREQILNQSKTISDEMRQKHEAMTAALERATAQLREEKTDRAALASLFMELAMRLNNEFKIPSAEDLE